MIRWNLREVRAEVLTVLMLITSCYHLCGQVIGFEQIGLEDGLSQISVRNIAQDKYGSIWLATRNGLNRYDGKKVTTYWTSENGNSILENQIQRLHTQDSLLWISTPNSVASFDLKTETFQNYSFQEVSELLVHKAHIWVATQTELLRYNPQLDSFLQVPISLGSGAIIKSLAYYGKNLLIGTDMGVWQMDDNGVSKFIPETYHVRCMFVDSKMNIWIGTNYQGLLKIHDGKVINHYRSPKISNDFVRCVEEDEDGKIWVGTFTGLDVIHKSGEIFHYKNNKSIESSLSHNSVWSLFKDREGAMWVGTYFGGVNIFHPTQRIYNFYPENLQSDQSINFRVVGQVLEDNDQNLWICTDGGGLNFFDREKGTFSYLKFQQGKNSISGNNVKSICLQGDSALWVGTHRGGLNRLDLNTKKFDLFRLEGTNSDSITTAPEIRNIVKYGEDLLLGTSNGLVLFDQSDQTFKPFLKEKHLLGSKSVLAIWLSDENELWVGTERSGLFRYDIESGEVRNYRSEIKFSTRLPSNTIYAIHKDHMNRYWIGTSNGLCQYLADEDRFELYGTEDGLVGNVVFGIVESRFSGLVVETNKGINFFKPHDRSFQSITFANGLPLRELSHNGIYSSDDGHLFVSGIGGLVEFKESDFLAIEPTSSPMITGISVNNERISPSTHSDIINTTILEAPKINLRHEHSTITFSVSDMSFTKASKQGLEYQLKGLDDKWVKAEEKSEITYTNLDNGNYTFLLRSINNPELSQALAIKMTPPWYLSKTAIILYIITGLGLILLINYQYIRQSKLSYNLSAEKESHKKDEELNKKKISFFTNISHEFRTPLTLISGQIELLLESTSLSADAYKRVLNVQKNTLRLKNLISELLNFRKLEQGHLRLKVSKTDFVSFIEEIYASFVELAKHGNIDYLLKTDFRHLDLWYDQNQLEKVFYNLLANAFKFTPRGGQIIVNLYEENDNLFAEVINTGSIIPDEMVDKVFDRFYQLENLGMDNSKGTGIGLALAKGVVEAHKGDLSVNSTYADQTTLFRVKLKKGKEHYDEESIVTSEETISPKMADHHGYTESSAESNPNDLGISNETILIVEDNQEVREFLNDLISPLYKTERACNGTEAIEMVKISPPDLILSDVLMPQMKGTEMCAILKSDILTSHIPIILLTARGSDEHRIEGLETGADDYISKPFNTKILLARINNVLTNRKTIQNKFKENPTQFVKKVAKKRIDKEFMEKAQNAVLENIANSNYNVDAFCKDMTLGRTNLFVKIKGITGLTPNEFISGIRLGKAAQMILHQPEITVSDIAYACGFTSPSYFSRAFKAKYGVSPSDYNGQSTRSNTELSTETATA